MQFNMMSSETFLLFMIWTHPLQMREYPLQYASTDKSKKSHYSKVKFYMVMWLLIQM